MSEDRITKYTDWTLKHLPQKIPELVVKKAMQMCEWTYFSGLNVMELDDRGPAIIVYKAANEEDLRLYWFDLFCNRISQEWELFDRKENEKKWRFLRATVKNGKRLYIEQKNYKYNAIEDTRLDWFEKHLNLIKPVISSKSWDKKVEEYIHLLNTWYKEPHWDYDRDRLCFIEISDSIET